VPSLTPSRLLELLGTANSPAAEDRVYAAAVLERLLALVSFSEVVACFLVPVAFCLPVQASCVLIASFRLPPSF
jgi:hypothetical protein